MPWSRNSHPPFRTTHCPTSPDQTATGTTALLSPVAFFCSLPGQPRAASVPTNRTARAGAVPDKEIVS